MRSGAPGYLVNMRTQTSWARIWSVQMTFCLLKMRCTLLHFLCKIGVEQSTTNSFLRIWTGVEFGRIFLTFFIVNSKLFVQNWFVFRQHSSHGDVQINNKTPILYIYRCKLFNISLMFAYEFIQSEVSFFVVIPT